MVQEDAVVTTSRDVARSAGVSRSTVSEVLNGRGHKFSPATREKVEQAARDLGYQPSAAARSLVRGTSDLVIAFLPNTTFGGNLQNIFEQATDELAQHGLILVLRFSTPSADSFDRIISTLNPRAVLSYMPFTAQERQIMQARGVEGFDPTTSADQGSVDYNIGRMQARYLYDKGHRRLAFAHLIDSRQELFADSREEGVRDECRDRGLPEPVSLRLGIDRIEALAALDSLGDLPVAIACYNDDVAASIVSAAIIRGRQIPDNVAVVGMDNTPLSRVMVPRLSTIDYPVADAAHGTVAGIIAGITGDPVNSPDQLIQFRVLDRETA
ncbi:LacI family DNA-binding transcriptional regulator [Leifsonia kafniensis]|uniref:LacI family DNA-binding transcriptional regulator n=1 Tax=Leifsonia kafniensis TaxID=475957 RepID=A0ABP7JZH0_9MICO